MHPQYKNLEPLKYGSFKGSLGSFEGVEMMRQGFRVKGKADK